MAFDPPFPIIVDAAYYRYGYGTTLARRGISRSNCHRGGWEDIVRWVNGLWVSETGMGDLQGMAPTIERARRRISVRLATY